MSFGVENSLELLDYAYQGPEKFLHLTKRDSHYRGALVNSLKIINSLFNVTFIATLNGHVILNETIPRLDKPNYYFTEGE